MRFFSSNQQFAYCAASFPAVQSLTANLSVLTHCAAPFPVSSVSDRSPECIDALCGAFPGSSVSDRSPECFDALCGAFPAVQFLTAHLSVLTHCAAPCLRSQTLTKAEDTLNASWAASE